MTLRVAIVAHHALGGSGVMAVEWAHLLARRGHDVHLVRCGASTRDALHQQEATAPTVHLVAPPGHPVLDRPSLVAGVTSALLRLHAEAPVDVVHVHYALPFALVAPVLRTLEAPPRCVVSLHGSDVVGIGADPAYSPAIAQALRSASAVTAPSRWLAEEARASGLADDVTLLPNFIDLAHFAPGDQERRAPIASLFGDDDGTPVLLHVSNLRPVKRARDTVAIARAIGRRVRLVIVGDGPEREKLERLAAPLGDDVRFVGPLCDPAPWFRAADCLLVPSDSESFGLVALEALACGTPVVASAAGGLPGWLREVEAAALCAVGDVDGFARAALRFLDAPRPDALRRAARTAAEAIGGEDAAAAFAETLYSPPPIA